MPTGYEDIDSLVEQQNSLLQQQEQQQNDIIQKQTQMQVDELNREKEKLQKETEKTTQGLYANWQKQANQYGTSAEQLAQQGLGNSGYAETTKTALYNAYQKSVTDTLNNSRDLYSDYNFKIQQARQSGSIQQAQSALELYSQRLQLLAQNYELRQDREQYLYQKQRDTVSDQQWQKSFDEQVKQNELENQWKQKNYDYQVQRDAVSDSQWQKNYDYQVQRDNVSDSQWKQQFDYQKQRDTVSDQQWQKQYELSKKNSTASSSKSSSSKSSTSKNNSSNSGSLQVSGNSNNISDYAKTTANNLKMIKNQLGGKLGQSVIKDAQNTISSLVESGKLTVQEAEYIYKEVGI